MEEDLLAEKCLMDLTRVDAVGLMDTGLMELSGGGRLVESLPNGGEGTNDGEKPRPFHPLHNAHTGEIQFELQIGKYSTNTIYIYSTKHL